MEQKIERFGTDLVGKQMQVIEQRTLLGKQVRVYGTKENPLFLAKDVAEWIEHSNTSKMLKSVDEEEKRTITISYSGNMTTNQLFLTEDGLYEVLMQSRKPIAKQFKKEVKKILKQIRQTGGYIPIEEETEEDFFARALLIAQKTLEKKDQLLRAKEKVINGLKPKADYTDLILQNKSLVNITQIAQDYGMSAQKFNDLLNKFRIQYKQNEQWILYAKYKDCGYVGSETFKFTHKSSRIKDVKMNTKWTQKGRRFLYDFLKEKGILPVMEREII